MSKRAKFAGHVAGMLQGPLDEDIITNKLIENIEKACTDKDNSAFHDALWQATALLTSTEGESPVDTY